MIERIIRGSARTPLLSVMIALTASVLGVLAYGELPRDVFPNLSAPVFNVIVQNAAMGAEELARRRFQGCLARAAFGPPISWA
jgi:heavy metal efflux system protein